MSSIDRFFEACAKGDVEALRVLLANDRSLARATAPPNPYGGWTGLHSAAKGGHVEAVRLLIDHGADPNAREEGDNTYPLHWAAAGRYLEIVRALVDAGGDPHGIGDVHQLDAIGWATFYHAEPPQPESWDVAAFLVERGARHHIFSAMTIGDLRLIRAVIDESPKALERRMSRFEHGVTPVHFAVSRKRYDILDLLIARGADVNGEDAHGQTALAYALAHGDTEAVRRLQAAGAKPPNTMAASDVTVRMTTLAGSVTKTIPMITVPDVAATLDWYVSIGFTEKGRVADEGLVNWGLLSFGDAEVMVSMNGRTGRQSVSLWFYTDQVDELYRLLKARQLHEAEAALGGADANGQRLEIFQEIYDPFYGGREFGIRDPNGYELFFRRG